MNLIRNEKLLKGYMTAKENNERIEYWFIDMEGNKIKIWPVLEVLGDTFIHCLNLTNGGKLIIHRNRIKWQKI